MPDDGRQPEEDDRRQMTDDSPDQKDDGTEKIACQQTACTQKPGEGGTTDV